MEGSQVRMAGQLSGSRQLMEGSQDGWTTVRQQTVNGGNSGWLDNCQAADS